MKSKNSAMTVLHGFFWLLLCAVCDFVYAAPNPLLGIQTGYPDVYFKSSSSPAASYTAGTGTLSITSQPLTVTYISGGLPSFVTGGVLSLTLNIDANGTFSGGSFTMTGVVDSYGSPLLTGNVTNYGIADLNTAVGGTDRLEVAMTANGGSLLSVMGGSGASLGVIIALENSTYSGSFGADWNSAVVAGDLGPLPVTPPTSASGTGTIGYWKNHPAAWPVSSLILGNVSYTNSQALSILGMAVKGDKSISLAQQLIAAKLNVLIGNPSGCINATIAASDQWLINHGGVASTQRSWDGGDVLHDELDAYNNGLLCAPPRP